MEHKTDMIITKYKKMIMAENETDISITIIDKYNTLIMTEHRTDMNLTKIGRYKKKKVNITSTAEYKTNMNITEKLSSTFTMEH